MKKVILITLTAFLSVSCSDCNKTSSATKTEDEQTAAVYQCPMDCESGKTYADAGKCPVCGMDLEKKN